MEGDILNNDIFDKLNKQQKDAVLHKDGPAIILAVPGAGKTTVLISRTANLIFNHNVNPRSILSITFSKASAHDMKDRFSSMFGNSGKTAHFSTIHSFSYFLIREYARENGLELNLMEGNDTSVNKIRLLKEIYKQVNSAFLSEDKLDELLNTIGFVKNMMIEVDEFEEHKNFKIKNFDKIFMSYETYKKENNLIDFDDMLTMSFEVLRDNPDILKRYQDRYQYVQVDEGQDTSRIQNEIIKLISNKKDNLFIVADDDQSIYGFRGAYPEELFIFKDQYPDAKVYFMEENYRSTQNIVSVCNSFIKQNKKRYNKELFTKNESLNPVTITKLKRQEDQYEYILDDIRKNMNYSETAILFRNNISSISIIDYLERFNIPVYMKDSKLHFFKHWVVLDIICFFNLAIDDSDDSSFEKIYYKMNAYISKIAVNFVKNGNNSSSVFDRLLEFPNFKSFQKDNIKKIKSKFKSILRKTPFEAIEYIEKDLDYMKYLQDNCKSFGYSFENVNTVLFHLKSIAKGTNSICEFMDKLKSLKYIIEDAKNNKDKAAITLSTIHSAKGLEFDDVYLVDLIDGDFPSVNSLELASLGDLKPIEEERRLFYVGMTRARKSLNLLTFNYRNEERVFYSSFINELENLLNLSKVKDHEFKIGSNVEHIKFGKGIIKDIDSETISIKFGNDHVKQLSLNLCIEKNLLSLS